jgi:hypothetical protein
MRALRIAPRAALALLSLAGGALLSLPSRAPGFSLAGFSLTTLVRDFRCFNNWLPGENLNLTPDPVNFPGAVGPALACWKAGVEWGSFMHNGQGFGDPTQVFPDGLGSGGANFDFVWQGLADQIGMAPDSRTMSRSPVSLGAGVIAQTIGAEPPGAGAPAPNAMGWRIVFSPDFSWFDGPGTLTPFDPRYDIQGIGTLQLGQALGLLPSAVAGSTMFPTVNPGPDSVSRRSLAQDDILGVQAIYGVVASTKPRILQFVGQPVAQQPLVIQGLNFHPTNNFVWFNRGGLSTNAGTGATSPIVVGPVPSTGGGTFLTVIPPCNVVDGDVFVKVGAATDGATLSNGRPIHFVQGGNGAPCAQCIGSMTPSTIPVFAVPQGEVTVTAPTAGAVMPCIPGIPPCASPSQYTTITGVEFDGVLLGPSQFTALSDTQVRFTLPIVSTLGVKSVRLVNAGGVSCAESVTVAAVSGPVLDTGPAIQLPGQTFTARMATPLGFSPILVFSASNLPSSLPGIVDLGIGNGFADISFLPTPAPNAAGMSQVSFVIAPVSLSGTLYFQLVAVNTNNPFGNLPLPVSAVRSVTVP